MRLTFLLVAAMTMTTAAAAQTPAACEEDLAAVDASFDDTIGRLEASASAGDAAKCVAWRAHVDVMEAARDVFRRCLSGHARGENIGQLDVSIADFLSVINARCPSE